MSQKSRSTAFLLCYFLGFLGVHRFYLKRVVSGALMLVTLGGLGIWWMVDAVLLAAGLLDDRDGNKLRTGPPDPDRPHAGFWVRLAAMSVDLVILNLVLTVVMTALSLLLPLLGLGAAAGLGAAGTGGSLGAVDPAQARTMGAILGAALVLVTLAAVPVYFGVQHASRHRATVGKRCFELQVCAADGGDIGLGRGLWRGVCYLFSTLPLYLGFVLAGLTRDKRALHDYLAGTRVIHAGAASAASEAAPVPAADPPTVARAGVTHGAQASGGGDTALIVAGAVLLAAAVALALLS